MAKKIHYNHYKIHTYLYQQKDKHLTEEQKKALETQMSREHDC